MKISYNWLKSYIDIDLPEIELADLLTDIGLEIEGVEHYESIKGGLEGIVVGKVLSVTSHPDADKLKVTSVDVNGEEHLQIVCGAPNVAEGQKVPVALVGTSLFSSEGDAFKIKKAKIRGVESFGMICAEDELGISDDHDGIMVLSDDVEVGKSLNEIYPVERDVIFEVGLTPNRPDAFHHIGVARDLVAALNYRNELDLSLNWPDLSGFKPGNEAAVRVSVEAKEACPRYAGVVIKDIEVKPSPVWLQNRLNAIGQRPINNVVDITNFIMHEYGQPLHAFDLDVVQSDVIVKTLPQNAVFETLDEVERKLSDEDLMICNASDGMCIAGVFGGIHSGVKESTSAIFLESAYFDPKSIRRTSTRHGLRTDAAIHFEKGIDPEITVSALKRAALLIEELAGGRVVSAITDIQNSEFKPYKVNLNLSQLRKLAGVDIPQQTVENILGLLEVRVVNQNDLFWALEVPRYRTDVTREADVIEDILRIYGFNNVPIPDKINASIESRSDRSADQLYEKLAGQLVSRGFYEIMVNSISREKYYDDETGMVRLMNNLNAELTIMREQMLYAGLEPVKYNINRNNKNCRFFELGKRYYVDEEGFGESEKLSLWLTGNVHDANWIQKATPVDFYYLKTVVDGLLKMAGISETRLSVELPDTMQYGQTYLFRNKALVSFGLIKPSELEKLDIDQPVYYAELDWKLLVKGNQKAKILFSELPKYPSVRRDLALLVDKKTTFESMKKIARKFGKKTLRTVDLFDDYRDKNMSDHKKSYAISFIFRDDHKTLSDKEVDKIMKQLMEAYQKDLGAVIR